jgi:hypothetical protein
MAKPLFIPLKREFFDAFERGEKTVEYRPYGVRWNERTCEVGRPVMLSNGYGNHRRLKGHVVQFAKSTAASKTKSWESCYGPGECEVACIHIEVA